MPDTTKTNPPPQQTCAGTTPPPTCDILSHFTAIHLIGDSMMRHLAQSLNILLRADLPTGARATWRPADSNPTRLLDPTNPTSALPSSPSSTTTDTTINCTCRTLFDDHTCEMAGYVAIGTQKIRKNDPDSFACPLSTLPKIDFLPSAKGPPTEKEVGDFKKRVRDRGKGEVFVFGQGGWDDFEVGAAKAWVRVFEVALEGVVEGFVRPVGGDVAESGMDVQAGAALAADALSAGSAPPSVPPRRRQASLDPPLVNSRISHSYDTPPRLWISPNAQGLHKNPFFVFGQNNIKLMNFEREMRGWLDGGEGGWEGHPSKGYPSQEYSGLEEEKQGQGKEKGRGWDTLGMFNLTVQSSSVDGTHAGMEANLVKAMVVVNWLGWVAQSLGHS